jgi:hypothetical protein
VNTVAVPRLPDPPLYVPFRHGRYDVAAGLAKLGRDAGGGDADRTAFQFDRAFPVFRAAKLASRARAFTEYVCASDWDAAVAGAVVSFIAARLVRESPALFREARDAGRRVLDCELTGERLHFDDAMRLAGVDGRGEVAPPYADCLDALACQVQEDLAIVRVEPGRHWLAYAHVCLPNGWAPAEKVGGSFAAVHEPVAGMGELNRRGDEFARVMVAATDGLVRFAWGVTFDDALDHHPATSRPRFDPAEPRAFLRVERQTIWGLSEVGASLFTIRTYLYDCREIRQDAVVRGALASALRSMTPASLAYKGLAPHVGGLIRWLESGGGGR